MFINSLWVLVTTEVDCIFQDEKIPHPSGSSKTVDHPLIERWGSILNLGVPRTLAEMICILGPCHEKWYSFCLVLWDARSHT